MYAVLFPGQGSQALGMGRFLFDEFKIARETFEEASAAINLDLKELCFNSSESTLALTENTQPALLCVSIATWRVLKSEYNLAPSALAGHSIGEYAALVAAESLNFSDAMRSVRLRGQFMQTAVPVGQGGMTAVLGLDDEQVRFLCEWTVQQSGFSPLSPANFNSPGQVVISGSAEALTWLKNNFNPEVIPGEAKRAKLIPLTVSAPFHCDMMKPAETKMTKVLEEISFQKAQVPVVQNFSADFTQTADELRHNLIRQISAPVLWTQSVRKIRSKGIAAGIECGHGKVLSGLCKKIDGEFKMWSTNSLDDLKLIAESIKALGH